MSINQSKTHLAITGASGLVGSRVTGLFADQYDFQHLDRSNVSQPVDITDRDSVFAALENSSAEYIIHLAAFTDVNASWQQNGDKTGPAYQVNVVGTKNLVEACQVFAKKMIHVSTAYVFDGESDDSYTEEATPNPIEWYGQTKQMAEEVIRESDIDWAIFRIDQPFANQPHIKADIAHKIIKALQTNSLYPQFTDHFFGPTIIEDFAKTLDWAIRTSASGLFHASSGERWTDFDFASEIKKAHNLLGEVKPGKLADYLKSQPRPYQRNTAMNCSKLHQAIDFQLKTISQAISEIQYLDL